MAKKSAPKKKNKRKAPNGVVMKQQKPARENPFETICSRRKFDILGKKRKGEETHLGLSRSRGIEKRKKTLLKEYEESWKASSFVDKRIGEQNEELQEFDKGIMRSQRQRQLKFSKKSMYNLSDGEDDGFGVSGFGSISGKDDFEDDVAFDDDDGDGDGEEGKKKKKLAMLNGLSFHEPMNSLEQEGEENRHKSKKEVMKEVISKSKYFKAQKAKDKEEHVQLMEELDKNFASLQEQLSTLTASRKQNVLKSLVNKDITSDQIKKKDKFVTQDTEDDKQDKPDSYDKLVKELALDMRAQPSDRTKTPEEIAQQERERLEKLEEERQKRMQAADDFSDEENDNVEKPLNQMARSVSGDDLGDSFALDEEPRAAKGWVDEILEKDVEDSENGDDDSSEDSEGNEDDGESEESDEDNVGEEKTMSLKDWEQSDDDDLGTDLGEEEEEEEENVVSPVKDKKEKIIGQKNVAAETAKRDGESLKKKGNQPSSIPFIIQAPKDFEELSSLLENCSNADVIEIIKRIRATDAIKLAAENRKKMQVFYGLLLQYFAVLASKKPLNFELLNMLVKPLMEISIELPYFSAICARQRIMRTRNEFCEAVKNSEDGCWPSLKTLLLLRLWSMIFPCSDFRHPVMTPAILLMCEYLIRCPIMSGRDIAVGSFLCSMVLTVARQSRKYCPEAIIFLRTLLMTASQNKPALDSEFQFYHLMELKTLSPLLCVHDRIMEFSPLNFMMVMDMADDSSFFSSDNFRVGVLLTVVETLGGFIDIYGQLSSFPEIFVPVSSLLLEVTQQENLPDALQDKYREVAEIIKKKVDEHHLLRRPLQMRKQKPVPIKLVAPKFEENFVKGRDYDPDRERAERRKLQKLIKQEAKKAARELRKDNHFLATVKEKEKEQWEEERAEKLGKARAFLQEQEHAFKSGQLGKGRKRRR